MPLCIPSTRTERLSYKVALRNGWVSATLFYDVNRKPAPVIKDYVAHFLTRPNFFGFCHG